MYFKEVKKWMTSYGSFYSTCLPSEFKFHLPKGEKIGCNFVYGMSFSYPGRGEIRPPESHPTFGQMQELRVHSDVCVGNVTFVRVQGMNDRFDRWMEAIFAIQQYEEDLWIGKLIAFERGNWRGHVVGWGGQSQWARFGVIEFTIVEFKDSTLAYELHTLSDKGERQIKRFKTLVELT